MLNSSKLEPTFMYMSELKIKVRKTLDSKTSFNYCSRDVVYDVLQFSLGYKHSLVSAKLGVDMVKLGLFKNLRIS